MKRTRFWLLGLLLLSSGALAVFLGGRESGPREPDTGADSTTQGPDRPELLTADGVTPPSSPGLAPRDPPAPAVPEAAARGPVRVRVVGPGGVPLLGVFVRPKSQHGTETRTHEAVATDGRGEVALADLAYDGSVTLGFYRKSPDSRRKGPTLADRLDPWGGGLNRVPVTGPDVDYRAQTGLQMTVRVVAADTGGDVAGARVKSRHGRDADAREWAPAPRAFLVMPHVGRPAMLGWRVEALDGWLAWEQGWVTVTVSPYAESLEAVYPLRRELAVSVLPLESEGGAAPAEIADLTVAGRRSWKWSFEGDAYGRLQVRGVPFLRDEILDLQLCRPDRTGPVRVRTVLPDHPAARVELEVVMPKDGQLDESFTNAAIGIGGGGRSGSFFRSRGRPRSRGAILVTVRRRNGQPAVGAEVKCKRRTPQRADRDGRVRFEHLAPGEHQIIVHSAGLLPMAQKVAVPEQGEVAVELQEGAGGTLDVLVVDDEHRPLSFATLEIKTPSGLPWVDMRDGTVQRIDPHTDVLGVRRLTHLEQGLVEITAAWGSRKETAKANVKEGEASSVLVVLPRPAPPR